MATAPPKVLSVGPLEDHADFMKQILVPGTADEKPNRGSVCVITITNVHNVDMGGYEDVAEFTIGERKGNVPGFFDKVLMSMKKGEHAYVKSKVDLIHETERFYWKNTFKFNIYLQSFQRSTDLEDLDWGERIKMAQNHMNKGSEHVKGEEIIRALWEFDAALEYLNIASQSNKPARQLLHQHKTLIVQCHFCIIDCRLDRKIDDPHTVIKHCNAVLELDDKSAKALFLRGQAYFKRHRYEEARADFVSVLEIEPQNNKAQKMIHDIDDILENE